VPAAFFRKCQPASERKPTYFDFDKSIQNALEGIDFILTYLRNNPSASVDIIGHADELGSAYNDKLSNARAAKVKAF
jgi:OOP family OmpA-OmpF porin